MRSTNTLTQLIILITAFLSLTACADIETLEDENTSVDKIIGGKVVKKAPAHVGVILGELTNGDLISLCTATLIDDNTVLTAAHCWGQDDEEKLLMRQAVDAGIIYICLGDKDWGKKNGLYCSNGKAAQIINFEVHNKYHTEVNPFDISVARLGNSFPEITKPALATKAKDTKGTTISYGYGANKTRVVQYFTDRPSEVVKSEQGDSKLRQLQRTTISNQECNQQIDGLNLNHPPVTGNNICINVNRKANLCHGDSGGPTFINGKLAGVTSRGTSNVNERNGRSKTCDGSGPTVLMSVRKFRSWINKAKRRL